MDDKKLKAPCSRVRYFLPTHSQESEGESKEHSVTDKKVGDPVPKTEEKTKEQLQKELESANRKNDQLENENIKLKKKNKSAENKIKELQQNKNELQQKIPQRLQRKGRLCTNDCVLSCLLWICNKKLPKHPCACGPNMRTLITIEAERKLRKNIKNEYLRCIAFMFILEACGIVSKYRNKRRDSYYNKDNAWEKLMGVDAKKRAVIIGSYFFDKDTVGHCWVCDLNTDSRKNGCLTIYDPQHADLPIKVNEQDFRHLVEKVDGVLVFTVNFKKLKKIIKRHKKCILHETSNDAGKTNHTEEPKIIELPDEPTAIASSEELKISELPDELTGMELPESTALESPTRIMTILTI